MLLKTLRRFLERISSPVGFCSRTLWGSAARWQGHRNKNSHAWFESNLGVLQEDCTWKAGPEDDPGVRGWSLIYAPKHLRRPVSDEEQKASETTIQGKQWLFKHNWVSFLLFLYRASGLSGHKFSSAMFQTGSESKHDFYSAMYLPSVTRAGCFWSQPISKAAASAWSKSDSISERLRTNHKLFGKQNASYLMRRSGSHAIVTRVYLRFVDNTHYQFL